MASTIMRAKKHTGLDALEKFVKKADPRAQIPAQVYISHSKTCTAIWDEYPKSRYHVLVLPKARFAIPDSARSTSAGSAAVHVPTDNLKNLRSLANYQHALPVLSQIKELADEVVSLIQEDMEAVHGRTWPIQIGFHANESMPHLHCHVLSQDFTGECLKKAPKHWNSFNPFLGFFVHLDDAIKWAKAKDLGFKLPSKDVAERMLKEPMRCHRPDKTKLSNIAAVKAHMQEHWKEDQAAAGTATHSTTAMDVDDEDTTKRSATKAANDDDSDATEDED